MELTEEMKEAIRILREDMTAKEFKELRERLDHIETQHSERDAKWEEAYGKREAAPPAGQEPPKEPAKEPAGEPAGEGGTPTPPPVKTEPVVEPKKGRVPWYERDVYSHG